MDHARDPRKDNIIIVRKQITSANDKYCDLSIMYLEYTNIKDM